MGRISKKKQNKKIYIISNIILSIYFLITLFLLGLIIKLSILPIKYILVILPIYIISTLLFMFLIIKKKIKNGVKVFIDIIVLILIMIYGAGLIYLNKTLHFIDKIGVKDYQIEEYYILVLEKSNYTSINDLNNFEIGIYNGGENYINALNELDKKINFKEKKYSNYVEVANALLDKREDAIMVSDSYKTILEEQLKDFKENVKILDTISVKVKNEIIVENVDVTKDSFNIYISGIDVYGDISSVSRSDVNMIMTVNPNTNKILLTSIPRDYYVRLHGTTGYKDKLTHAGLYGIKMSITTLEDLFGIDIDYYIRVNFTTLINIVDAIGGIDINSDLAFTAHTNSSCTYAKGNNHLDGKCALAFSRERYAYQEGDRHRVQNQQVVLTAILNKALSSKTLITKYTNILESLESSFQTNMPQENIYSLVNMQLDQMPKWSIQTISVNGKDSFNYTYSYSSNKLYVMEPNMQTVAIATAKMKEVES